MAVSILLCKEEKHRHTILPWPVWAKASQPGTAIYQGIVNCDFIKKLAKTRHKDTYKVNDIVEATVDMLKTDASVMQKHVEGIHNAICNKYSLLPYC